MKDKNGNERPPFKKGYHVVLEQGVWCYEIAYTELDR